MPRKILVVEDDPDFRKLLMNLLVDAGFFVEGAEDGHGAMNILIHNSRIAAVLSDVSMPNMDGIQLLEQVGTKFPKVPVVLMSGGVFDCETNKKLGSAVRFFEKPFEMEELFEALRDVIRQ